jgi:hypothetical protein
MSKRAEWTWGYTAAEVLPYAERKEAHHAARVAHWTREWEQAQAILTKHERQNLTPPTLRKATTQASGHMHTHPAPETPPEVYQAQQRAYEAQNKVQVHTAARDEAAKYVRALRAGHAGVELRLTVDDLDYFGIGHTTDTPDPEA